MLIPSTIYFILFSEETEGLVGEGKKTSTRKQKVTTGRSCINSVNLCNFFFFSEENESLVGEGKKKTSTRKQKVTTGRSCVNSINIINFILFSEETECLVKENVSDGELCISCTSIEFFS